MSRQAQLHGSRRLGQCRSNCRGAESNRPTGSAEGHAAIHCDKLFLAIRKGLKNFVASADNLTIVEDGTELSQFIASAHVFVAPSHAEAMPYCALQALASGRPLIVSNTAGNRETTDEMVNGMLVPTGNAAALADAIQRMIAHRDLLPAMARASRLKAERHFSNVPVHTALNAALGLA